MALDLATANRIVEACIAEGRTIGRNFSIAVVDEGGHIVAIQRMDGAAFVSPRIALGKAFACAAFRREGPQLQQMGENPAFVAGLVEMTGGQFFASLGACRIMLNGQMMGAVGVSGAAPEQDQQVAEAGIRVLSS
ncbi:MAG TPA: heme-binding protein [Chloroflexota bacterium]|nr:heme-binding protein [Chloroflexota bacterium]